MSVYSSPLQSSLQPAWPAKSAPASQYRLGSGPGSRRRRRNEPISHCQAKENEGRRRSSSRHSRLGQVRGAITKVFTPALGNRALLESRGNPGQGYSHDSSSQIQPNCVCVCVYLRDPTQSSNLTIFMALLISNKSVAWGQVCWSGPVNRVVAILAQIWHFGRLSHHHQDGTGEGR